MNSFEEIERKRLDSFLEAIEPWSSAYEEATFSFIGIKTEAGIEILQGQLLLPNGKPSLRHKVVETDSFIGGIYTLREANQSYRGLLERLSEGELDTPFGKVRLSRGSRDSISASFTPFPPGFENNQVRDVKFSLYGAQGHELPSTSQAIVELRASKAPYGSIKELATELSIFEYREDVAIIHVLAAHVFALDASSEIKNASVKLGVYLANGLKTQDCSLGYKVIVKGEVTDRKRIEGEEFNWVALEEHQYGIKELTLPEGAVLQCFAAYAGQFQHQRWVIDPATFPNLLRVLHNGLDPDLEQLHKYLFDENHLKSFSRDFEIGIANLFFMLGFSVDPLKGKKLEDGPDMIATTIEGNVLVIECTTGQIDKEGKIGKLLHRARMLKEQLKNSAYGHLRVLPVIITALPKPSVTKIEDTNKCGVLVLTKEDLVAAIDRTIVSKGADTLFNEAWEILFPVEKNPLDKII